MLRKCINPKCDVVFNASVYKLSHSNILCKWCRRRALFYLDLTLNDAKAYVRDENNRKIAITIKNK